MNLDRVRELFACAVLGLWVGLVIAAAWSDAPRFAELVKEVTVPMILIASSLFVPSIGRRRNGNGNGR